MRAAYMTSPQPTHTYTSQASAPIKNTYGGNTVTTGAPMKSTVRTIRSSVQAVPRANPGSLVQSTAAVASPAALTTGMPNPSVIQRQKEAYTVMLDNQLRQGMNTLGTQLTQQKNYINARADQEKKQFIMQIDMEVAQQENILKQQHAEQKLQLQQQQQTQLSSLEEQALQLTMDYRQKKAEEEMNKSQFEMEQQQSYLQQQINDDMQKFGITKPLINSAPQLNFDGKGVVKDTQKGSILQAEQVLKSVDSSFNKFVLF